ncbi:Fc.00g082880.m01.CDS01 [Cosmosporella sp. VM-42]
MSPSIIDDQDNAVGKQYGFIGIGVMGWHMAMNVAKRIPAVATLTICDIDVEKVDKFITDAAQVTAAKVQAAKTPKEVAEASDIIITSLPAAKHVKLVFCDPDTGLLTVPRSNRRRLFLETSTFEVSVALEIAKLVAESELGDFLDSPVSGGPEAARLGTLAVIVGGDSSVFQKALPVLSYMGRPEKIYHCGPLGAGLAAKQANNYAACVSYLGLCEAMNIGVRYGLDPKILGEVINNSSGMSWNSINQNPVKGVIAKSSASRDFEGGATTELCQEIIGAALQLADHVKAKMVVGPLLREIFEKAVDDPRCKGKEYRSIYRLIAEDDAQSQEPKGN